MNCENCSIKITRGSKSGLCNSCVQINRAKERFQHWLKTGDLGLKVGTTVRGYLREELLNYYGNYCSICGTKDWQGKPLMLVLDHINGDASNNKKENLRFICPNCDSQLETYKSKNKGSARSHRAKYYNG